MTNNQQLPRTITAAEVRVGDRILIEWSTSACSEHTSTLTVAGLEEVASGWLWADDGSGGGAYVAAPGTAERKITLLDRPEPEPEWVADGICVDVVGDTWVLYNGKWCFPGTDGYSAKELQSNFGPISRHPAVVAAEKRGEQRVIEAIGEALASHPNPCDKHNDGDPVTCGWKRAVADVRRVIDGWAS